VGINWNAGLMRWRPHAGKDGKHYPLNHVHPFRFEVVMPAMEGRPETIVIVEVGFGLHCFTRKIQHTDDPADLYGDAREQRTFCHQRYELSKQLGAIVRDLQARPCAFASSDNFVTVEVTAADGATLRYGVFFNLKRQSAKRDGNVVLLVVQSAYCLDPGKPNPAKGKIRFNTLLGHALRGTRPKPPR
jgi:hypothetical protein